MVQIFVSREALLPDSETLIEHHEHREAEARIVEADRSNNDPRIGGLFRGCFRTQPQRMGGIIDYEDGGIARCPHCAWELEDEFCGHCGIPVYNELEWSNDDGSMSIASESLEEMRAGAYSSDYDSVETDEAQEPATTVDRHQQRARLGQIVGGVAGRDAYGHAQDRRDQNDRFSDQEIYSVGSTVDADNDNTVNGGSEESDADSESSSESDSDSMRSFLDDDEHSSDYEHTFPAADTFWCGGGVSDMGSSHDASHSHNEWSDTNENEQLEDDALDINQDQTEGYASVAGLSTPDRTHLYGTIPRSPATTLLSRRRPPGLGASSSHHASTLQHQESGTITSESERSEASLPPPTQRGRKRRHVIEDESSNDSSASDLDSQRPRKRKSSSQDTTAVNHLSSGSRAQDQQSRLSRRARGNQPSPIVIHSSPARLPSPSQARYRHRADRPRIASHLRRSAATRVGDARPSGKAENAFRSLSND